MTQNLWDQGATRDNNQASTQLRSHAGALSRLIVLDCSDSISGQFCARLLADYGANITLVEPPLGSPTRQMPPFDKQSEQSLLFFHLNTGKRSITLDRSTAQGETLWTELVAEADVVVLPPREDGAQLRAINPQLVTASVSSLGTTGPFADWEATEMIVQALSGMMHNNGNAGREPLYGCGQRASYAAGLAAYIGTLAALYARARGAPGQDVTIDATETATSMCFPYVLQHIYNGAVRSRGEQNSPVGQVRCRDGWVCIWIYNHRFVVAMKALGLDELIEDCRFNTPGTRQENWPILIGLIQEHVADRGADDLVADMQAANVIAARSSRPTDLYRDSHLATRDFWETVDTPDGPQPILGAPYRLSRTPRYVTGPAPALGADNNSVPNRQWYSGAARGPQKAGVA